MLYDQYMIYNDSLITMAVLNVRNMKELSTELKQ